MTRPYFSKSIAELETIFSALEDPALLRVLAEELQHRSTERARQLAERVAAALASRKGPAHMSDGESNVVKDQLTPDADCGEKDMSDRVLEERRHVTAQLLARLRTRLLDLSNRNKLLNFRFSERARTHVRVIDELPDLLYGKLADGRALLFEALPEPEDEPADEKTDEFLMALETARLEDETFKQAMEALGEEGLDETAPMGQRLERELKDRVRAALNMEPRPSRDVMTPAEYARQKGFEPSYDLPSPKENGEDQQSHLDDRIQTLLFPEQMERKLSGIRDGARFALSEMGFNILHAAFGYLEWYEADASQKTMFAPLVLHPLEMVRTLVRSTYRYAITSTGDDSQINITLRERLKKDFSIELPELADEDTPESYFAKVEDAIADQKRWRVRRFVTVGLFDFGRLAMYHDLDPDRWPAERTLSHHPVLVELLGGADGREIIFAPEYDADAPEISAKVPLLITEADSSQFSAIADVMDGRNLAIQGPPGTGKSQTITNIIAAALANGKRVLFVAEKMAALEVVKKRLDDAGLGQFVLELHSTKARKKDVLASLAERLKIKSTRAPTALDDAIAEESRLREQLTRYVMLINQPFGRSGKSLHDLFWAGTRARARAEALGLPRSLDEIALTGIEDLGPLEIERRQDVLAGISRMAKECIEQFGALDAHPWTPLGRTGISPFEQQELLRALDGWRGALVALCAAVAEGKDEHGLKLTGRTTAELTRLADALRYLDRDLEPIIAAALPALSSVGARTALDRLAERLSALDGQEIELKESLDWQEAPPAVAVVRQIDAGRRVLVDNHPFEGTVADLATFAAARQELGHRTRAAVEATRALQAAAGLAGPTSLSRVKPLIEAAALVTETPREALVRRSRSLFEETASPILQRAAKEAETVLAGRAELAKQIAVDETADVASLRVHATALRAAGLFGRVFGSGYKQARAVWAGRAKGGGKATPDAMADDLEALADHVAAVQKIGTDTRLATICGPYFEGVDSDFPYLLAVNDYAREVERRFASAELSDLRRVLLEADVSTLDALVVAAQPLSVALQALASAAESARAQLSDAEDLEALAATSDKTAQLAEALYKALVGGGFHSTTRTGQLERVAKTLEHRESEFQAIAADTTAREVLGLDLSGRGTDRTRLNATLALARDLADTKLSDDLLDALLCSDLPDRARRLVDFGAQLSARLADADNRGTEVMATGGLNEIRLTGGQPIAETAPAALSDRISSLLAAQDDLASWVTFNLAREEAREIGLGQLLATCERNGAAVLELPAAFDHALYRTLLQAAYSRHPEFKRFSGQSQEQARQRFQELDRHVVALQRQELAACLADARVEWGTNIGLKKGWTGLHLIQKEIAKRKKHIPLRDLFARAGLSIQQMKPCWMMSPASVAQFLRPEAIGFDLVVIDEASQMRPEDALGAVARSRQLVVVGDPKQLPPTSFFERLEVPDEDDEELEEEIDNESILDRALSIFHPARELRWHYRSRHESLIAFSNRRFYDGNLVVFPSPIAQHDDYGIEYVYVDQGRYTPKASVNLPEANIIAQAALQHMNRFPNRSLGLVTVNQAQREILAEEMDRLFARNSFAQEYREHWEETLEPFFVKNLENVQGDERDVIMISTVYGPREPGGPVQQHFGPINRVAGHRRLNVLFTRAKEKISVVTSMAPTDIKPSETSREGVHVLKSYIDFAKNRRIEPGVDSGRPPDSDFEVFVAERIEQHGFRVVPQVGVAGYFVDLAVKHPEDNTSYICAVECDGATYHSAKSARDRDRLRQEVLERLGWNVYRIWSTDWFSDPTGETRRLLKHLHELVGR